MFEHERSGAGSTVRAMQELHARMLADDVVTTDHLLAPTGHWAAALRSWTGRRYSSLSFFELEFLFYHALNCQHGTFTRGRDPFAAMKRRDTEVSLADAERALERLDREHEPLELALRFALFGNALDASQAKQRDEFSRDIRLITGELTGTARALTSAAAHTRRISMLLDNAGTELGMDLILVHELLHGSDATVILHAKPWPMFVSDATVADVHAHIEHWRTRTAPGSRLRSVGRVLDHAIGSQQFQIRAEPDWGEPRHFDELADETLEGIRDALVISKGDLNYRRHFGDRTWAPTTPIDVAAHGVAFESILLRTLKSEVVVGLSAEQQRSLAAEDQAWATHGRYAVAQQVGPIEEHVALGFTGS